MGMLTNTTRCGIRSGWRAVRFLVKERGSRLDGLRLPMRTRGLTPIRIVRLIRPGGRWGRLLGVRFVVATASLRGLLNFEFAHPPFGCTAAESDACISILYAPLGSFSVSTFNAIGITTFPGMTLWAALVGPAFTTNEPSFRSVIFIRKETSGLRSVSKGS